MNFKSFIFVLCCVMVPLSVRAENSARFSDADRAYLMTFMSGEYTKHCPGKMAKLRKGCRLPDSAGLYDVGGSLPDTTMTFPLPDFLTEKIAPAAEGHAYVQTGKDIIILRMADKIVTDAVSLHDAVEAKK